MENLEKQITKANEEKEILKKKIESQETEIEILRKSGSSELQKVANLKIKLDKELSDARKNIINLNEEKRMLKMEHESKLNELESDLKRLKNNLKSAEEDKEGLSKRINQLISSTDKNLTEQLKVKDDIIKVGMIFNQAGVINDPLVQCLP